MSKNPIRIAIADDSYVARSVLKQIVAGQADMFVAAEAQNGEEALDICRRATIDVLLLDIEMPGLDGIEVLKILLREKQTTKVIVVSALTQRHAPTAVQALSLGASAYLAKPTHLNQRRGLEHVAAELLDLIRNLVPISTRSTENEPGDEDHHSDTFRDALPFRSKPSKKARKDIKLVVVGSSTGGPNALSRLLQDISQPLNVPMFLVQHMPGMFLPQLAKRLSMDSGLHVVMGDHGIIAEPGTVYLAPADCHMELTRAKDDRIQIQLTDGPAEVFCKPSVNPLFRSAARGWGRHALGIILTGMGEDGLDGCRSLRYRNATIYVQDRESSVVWGMPRAVAGENLADGIFDINDIGTKINDLIKVIRADKVIL